MGGGRRAASSGEYRHVLQFLCQQGSGIRDKGGGGAGGQHPEAFRVTGHMPTAIRSFTVGAQFCHAEWVG